MMGFIRDNLSGYFNDLAASFDFTSLTLTRITFVDIIDILIVAYFIYKMLLWIKETRAWSLFKGVVVLLVIAAISFSLGFITVSWLIKTTLNWGILAIIILFQPELRKALEQLGKGRLVLPFGVLDGNTSISEATVDEIIKAAFAMAKVRTGALIIVEKDVKLGDFEQTGVAVDAIVTAQIIINIFEDKTPLHDGAVIVRHNRVAAASCILPLTQADIGQELGTRHRAGVGISELSDCLSIIVSEETGGVSLAVGGKIYKKQSPEDVRKRLNFGSDPKSAQPKEARP